MTVVTTRAILFRAHAYSESSQVLRFYTEGLGLVGVMARGSRRQASKGRGAVDTFGEGMAVIVHRPNRDLQTLREFSPSAVRLGLGRDLSRLAGASVLAELVLRHAGEEPHVELFHRLSVGLDRLAEVEPDELPVELLSQAWGVVQLLGFGPVLDVCTQCGRQLDDQEMGTFDLASGGVRCPACPSGDRPRRLGPVAREQLANLMAGRPVSDLRKPAAHVSLLDDFITYHMLGGRRLQSFQFLSSAGAEGNGLSTNGSPG